MDFLSITRWSVVANSGELSYFHGKTKSSLRTEETAFCFEAYYWNNYSNHLQEP